MAEHLTVANMFGNTLSVLLNLGDGVFMDVGELDVGVKPVGVAIGDLDGNGTLDLAVINRLGPFVDGTVSLLFNLGDGTFKEPVVLDTGFMPEAVVIGDLNGDGDSDLVVANSGSGNVSVLLNNGDGTFTDDERYETDSGPQSIGIGDLDGDGDLDLAVANAGGGNVSILLNNGNGTFGADMTFPVGGKGFSSPSSIVLGDVDGDGDLDFATANLEPFNVSVLLNNGDGAFGDEVLYPLFVPGSVAFGDLDGDGDLDLIIANEFIWIRLNDGDGHFGELTSMPACSGAFFVTTGDLDSDGDLDIVFTNANTVGFLSNNGDATFAEAEVFRIGAIAFGVAVGDLNGDGAPDLAVPNFFWGDSVSVLLNRCVDIPGDLDGDGSVGASDLLILLANWGRCADCDDCNADIDGDCTVGASDLLILLSNWG